MIRLKMSMPEMSVPSQCEALGRASVIDAFAVSGSKGAISGARSARMMIVAIRKYPRAKSLCWRRTSRKSSTLPARRARDLDPAGRCRRERLGAGHQRVRRGSMAK
jgi:hypothetical protein